ncbi:MAG: hypothetical protein EPO11_09720 [Gammaproteobacteria bacterium]|nr:MAG: hypothetical protein EPO11_09720 [Gammaproteobacteria bacterium]
MPQAKQRIWGEGLKDTIIKKRRLNLPPEAEEIGSLIQGVLSSIALQLILVDLEKIQQQLNSLKNILTKKEYRNPLLDALIKELETIIAPSDSTAPEQAISVWLRDFFDEDQLAQARQNIPENNSEPATIAPATTKKKESSFLKGLIASISSGAAIGAIIGAAPIVSGIFAPIAIFSIPTLATLGAFAGMATYVCAAVGRIIRKSLSLNEPATSDNTTNPETSGQTAEAQSEMRSTAVITTTIKQDSISDDEKLSNEDIDALEKAEKFLLRELEKIKQNEFIKSNTYPNQRVLEEDLETIQEALTRKIKTINTSSELGRIEDHKKALKLSPKVKQNPYSLWDSHAHLQPQPRTSQKKVMVTVLRSSLSL